MKKKILCLLLLAAVLFTAACTPTPVTGQFFAMDTLMNVTLYGSAAQKALPALQEEIFALEALLSTQDENSDIFRANSVKGETITIAPQTAELLSETLRISTETNGALDISVYPYIELWGFEDQAYRLPTEAELTAASGKVGYQNILLEEETLTLTNGARIALGAAAKGYAADRCTAILRDAGITSALLSLGGNIQALGSKPDGSKWTIGLEDPDQTQAYYTAIRVSDMAVVTSGDYQRNFQRDGKYYHHIIDPATGAPADSGLRAVTVVTEKGTYADCLSTALFVMGKEKAIAYWLEKRDFDMILVDTAHTVYLTPGIEELPERRAENYTFHRIGETP